MKKIFVNFILIIKTILGAKYKFNKPPQKKILIFDSKGATTKYYQYFYNQDCIILDVRGETINIYLIFAIFLNFKIPTLNEYIKQFIKYVRPEFIFNNSYNVRFFDIKKNDYDFTFTKIFTQSELKNHHDYEEFLKGKKKLNCDYLFVWSEAMKNLMKKNISGKYIINGSFYNNEGPVVNFDKLKNKLAFVSQYRTFKKKKNVTIETVKEQYHGMKFSWKTFFQPDLDVAFLLKEFCNKNNIDFEIIGALIDDKSGEKNFYSKKLGNSGWTYIEKSPERKGVHLTSEAKYIVTIDSTLGYECLARGQRVCFFSIRSKYLKTKYAWFGWPSNLQEEGQCWTTSNSLEDFERLINFLVFENNKSWNELRKNTLNDLAFYNQGNIIFKNFLKEIGLLVKKYDGELYQKNILKNS